jgi:alanine racemase
MIKISAYFHKPFETLNLITLSRANFLHNMRVIRDQTGLEVVPVLKANAYGHGLKQIASILAGHSETPFVAVDFYNEALLVRRECNTPVLVMGAIKSDNFKRMKLGGLLFAVSRTDTIEALGSLGKKVNVHVEIDTGMARQGVPLAGLDDLLLLIKEYPHIKVDGVMSHLADADNSFDDSYTHEQTKQFDQAVVRVRAAGFAPRYIHLAQSAGTTRPQSKFVNAVRPGIALYGINPLEKSDSKFEQLQKTKPVMTVWSSIIAVQKLKKGESVSYGRTFTATQPSVIGVLPFGYYEGLPRALSNRAVLLSGSGDKLPVRGRICMNHTMIDITNTQLKVGDKVKIISDNRADPNAVQSLCDSFDLFNYEFLVKINEQTRRIVVG